RHVAAIGVAGVRGIRHRPAGLLEYPRALRMPGPNRSGSAGRLYRVCIRGPEALHRGSLRSAEPRGIPHSNVPGRMADVSGETRLWLGYTRHASRAGEPSRRLSSGRILLAQHLRGNPGAAWAVGNRSVPMDCRRSGSPGPACGKHVTPRSVSRSRLPVDLGSVRSRLSHKREFRGDELSIRERTTVHVRRDVGGTEPPAAGSSHSCSIGLLMASGLLTEQEPREGENSATSFEPHALFTPSAIRGGAYLSLRYGLGVFVSLGNMLVMTRWIGPHPYGLFVTAIGIVAFLSNLARAGVDIYLVRLEPAPDQRIYDIAITLVLFISAALSLLGAISVPLLI